MEYSQLIEITLSLFLMSDSFSDSFSFFLCGRRAVTAPRGKRKALRDGVAPPRAERVAPRDPPDSQIAALNRAESTERGHGVPGTARIKSAAGRQKPRKRLLVKLDRCDQKIFHKTTLPIKRNKNLPARKSPSVFLPGRQHRQKPRFHQPQDLLRLQRRCLSPCDKNKIEPLFGQTGKLVVEKPKRLA